MKFYLIPIHLSECNILLILTISLIQYLCNFIFILTVCLSQIWMYFSEKCNTILSNVNCIAAQTLSKKLLCSAYNICISQFSFIFPNRKSFNTALSSLLFLIGKSWPAFGSIIVWQQVFLPSISRDSFISFTSPLPHIASIGTLIDKYAGTLRKSNVCAKNDW